MQNHGFRTAGVQKSFWNISFTLINKHLQYTMVSTLHKYNSFTSCRTKHSLKGNKNLMPVHVLVLNLLEDLKQIILTTGKQQFPNLGFTDFKFTYSDQKISKRKTLHCTNHTVLR